MDDREYKRLIASFERMINALLIIKQFWNSDGYDTEIQKLLNLKIRFQQEYKERKNDEKEVASKAKIK
jgi:hypothetical protein